MIWGQFPGGYLHKSFSQLSQPSTGIPPTTRLFPSRCVSMSCMAPSSSSSELKVELGKIMENPIFILSFITNATGFKDVFVYTVDI